MVSFTKRNISRFSSLVIYIHNLSLLLTSLGGKVFQKRDNTLRSNFVPNKKVYILMKIL